MDAGTVKESKKQVVPCVIRDIQISCEPDENYLGDKTARTVFRLEEAKALFVDTEFINKRCGEQEWEAGITLRLFWFDGKKAVEVATRESSLQIPKEEGIIRFCELLTSEDMLNGFTLCEGIYKVLVEINGNSGQSPDIHVVESRERAEEYCRIVHAGLDRCCDETDEQCKVREHSFRSFKREGLKDLRFYLMAENLLSHQWIYEFMIRVVEADGSLKVQRLITSGQYVKSPDGQDVLCFAVDLGGGGDNLWSDGEYMLIVSLFGQPLLRLNFSIGGDEIADNFEEEIRMGAAYTFAVRTEKSQHVPGDKDVILDRLYKLVGLRKVKEEITRICEYAEFIGLRRKNGFRDAYPPINMIFTGHPGTGKNTVAGMIGELFCKLGLLSKGTVHHFGRNDFVQEISGGNEETVVRRVLAASAGGVVFIDNAGDLFQPGDPNDRGVVVLGALLNLLMKKGQPDVLVILAGEADEMDDMLMGFPAIKKMFPRQLYFEGYTPEELLEIARGKLEKLQYRFTPAAEEKFFRMLKTACMLKGMDFTNGQYIDEQVERATLQMARRLMANRDSEYSKEDLMLITDTDIVEEEKNDSTKPLEKLKTMVGLGEVKQNLLQHLNYIYFVRERQLHGLADVLPPLNMIFSGNPGTGKHTVARMMADIYHSLGILLRHLVAEQTAINITADSGLTPQQGAALLLNSAQGGILYIDEASALPESEFGLALLEVILSELSTEEAGDVLVILAGSPDGMDKMLSVNPNLKDYFPYHFRFNDYLPDELLKITESKLKEMKYAFHPKAREAFGQWIDKVTGKHDRHLSNALLVEKMVNAVIRNLSERTMKIREERELTRQEMTTILLVDIPTELSDTPKWIQGTFDETEIEAALKDLDNVVGQVKAKKQIRDFVELARHYNQDGVKLSSKMSLQWCFSGNSAMGKGTMARVIGRLYKAMGIVDKGHVFNFKVEKMVGMVEEEAQRYIGEALLKSRGGIFLFDEDSPKLAGASGFRERVRAILMSQIAGNPGACMVIYAEPRNVLPVLNGEAEHASEIINILDFEDYNKEELMIILKRRLEKEKMKLTTTARQYMVNFIGSLVANEERSHASSRLMRIVGDLIVRNCLQRISANRKSVDSEEQISVQKQDVAMFTEQFIAGLMNERKRIGFV